MGKLFRVVASACLFWCVGPAQFETSEVIGTVRDATGAVAPNAAISLKNEQTGIEAKTTSDSNGLYDFFNVKVGVYSISAELTGFQTFTTAYLSVNVNARQRVDVTLQPGTMTQSVEVQAAETLETDTSEHGQVIQTQQIVELPLNGRNFSDLAMLTTQRSSLAVRLRPMLSPSSRSLPITTAPNTVVSEEQWSTP